MLTSIIWQAIAKKLWKIAKRKMINWLVNVFLERGIKRGLRGTVNFYQWTFLMINSSKKKRKNKKKRAIRRYKKNADELTKKCFAYLITDNGMRISTAHSTLFCEGLQTPREIKAIESALSQGTINISRLVNICLYLFLWLSFSIRYSFSKKLWYFYF